MSRKHKKQKDTSPKVPQKDKLKESLTIYQRDDFTEKQKQFINLVMDKETQIIFVKGKAGTAKTYLGVYCALHLLDSKRVSDLMYFRTVVESGKSLGSLPGELDEKFNPFMRPLEEKLEELLPRGDIQRLIKDERIEALPINYIRGASFNAKCLIADEAQNFTYEELTTFMTRFGRFSKMIIMGDPKQSDIGKRSGFNQFYKIFDTEKHKKLGIHTFELTETVRNPLLEEICNTIENGRPETTSPS